MGLKEQGQVDVMEEEFKQVFTGYMRFQLEAESEESLFRQAVFRGDWITKSPKILKKINKRRRGQPVTRHFLFALTMIDTDGHKRGYKEVTFKTAEGFYALSAAVDQQSEVFKEELAEEFDGLEIDVNRSYITIKA